MVNNHIILEPKRLFMFLLMSLVVILYNFCHKIIRKIIFVHF